MIQSGVQSTLLHNSLRPIITTQYIEYIHSKIAKSLYAINAAKNILSKDVLLMLYKSLVHFLFLYCIQTYSSSSNDTLKWQFTYKQHTRGPPQNHSRKFDLRLLQTGILKINASFAKKIPEKVEIITRTPANCVLVILV